MKDYLSTHLHIAAHLAVVALSIVIGAGFAHYANSSTVANIYTQLTEQNAYMLTLADITDRNGADAVTATIISDCTRRTEYESLLNNLATLQKKELVTLQNLFEGCGSFYGERKALMVARLDRELENLTNLNILLTSLNAEGLSLQDLERWNALVALEKQRSGLLADQARIQSDIITQLILGFGPTSAGVSKLVGEAQEIGQQLSVQDSQIDDLRNAIQH